MNPFLLIEDKQSRFVLRIWQTAIILVSTVVLALVISISNKLKQESRKNVTKDLQVVLRASREALQFWKENLRSDQIALSQLPRLNELVAKLSDHADNSILKGKIQGIIKPWMKSHHAVGFGIYDLSSSAWKIVGPELSLDSLKNLRLSPDFLLTYAGFNKGKAVLITASPFMSESLVKPVLLVFAIDASSSFSRITQLGEFGETGESYVATDNGEVLTVTRLSRLLTKTSVAEVGDNFKSTLAGRELAAHHSGLNIEGYTDYRNHAVVGAWTWDSELGLGLVTETDYSESYGPYNMTQKLVWLIIIIVTSGMLILILLREMRSRNLRKIESLKEMDESRKSLLSAVSHDLKNPLSSLLMANELLLKTLPKDSENSERRRKLLVRSHIAAEQMRQLITDLLDSSRIEAGKLQINPITCSADEIISHTMEVLEPIAADKGIEIYVQFPKELPLLFADPERVGQIFSNLIGNAIKFTPSLGKIFISAKESGDWVEFEIRDTGIGISREDIPHLFERYWQAKKIKSIGSGLGLAICQELVKLHGGDISVESESDVGTVFRFTLPVKGKDK